MIIDRSDGGSVRLEFRRQVVVATGRRPVRHERARHGGRGQEHTGEDIRRHGEVHRRFSQQGLDGQSERAARPSRSHLVVRHEPPG